MVLIENDDKSRFDETTGFPKYEVYNPDYTRDHLFFVEETQNGVLSIISEHESKEVLEKHGISPKNKLYFFGKPGTGKTHASEIIASELGYHLMVITWCDSIYGSSRIPIDRDLRSGLDNLSDVMLQLKDRHNRFVAVFKNFDSDPVMMGNLIMMTKYYDGDSIIVIHNTGKIGISAYLLDIFSEMIYFDIPEPEVRRNIINMYMASYMSADFNMNEIMDKSDGFTPKEVKDMSLEAYRRAILNGRRKISMEDVDYAWGRITDRRRVMLGGEADMIELAGFLDGEAMSNLDDDDDDKSVDKG